MKTKTLALLVLSAILAFSADPSGTWRGAQPAAGGATVPITFVFQVSGSTLTGTIDDGRGPQSFDSGTLTGNTIVFSQTRMLGSARFGKQRRMTMVYTGTLDDSGNTITFFRDNGMGAVSFTATKQ